MTFTVLSRAKCPRRVEIPHPAEVVCDLWPSHPHLVEVRVPQHDILHCCAGAFVGLEVGDLSGWIAGAAGRAGIVLKSEEKEFQLIVLWTYLFTSTIYIYKYSRFDFPWLQRIKVQYGNLALSPNTKNQRYRANGPPFFGQRAQMKAYTMKNICTTGFFLWTFLCWERDKELDGSRSIKKRSFQYSPT